MSNDIYRYGQAWVPGVGYSMTFRAPDPDDEWEFGPIRDIAWLATSGKTGTVSITVDPPKMERRQKLFEAINSIRVSRGIEVNYRAKDRSASYLRFWSSFVKVEVDDDGRLRFTVHVEHKRKELDFSMTQVAHRREKRAKFWRDLEGKAPSFGGAT